MSEQANNVEWKETGVLERIADVADKRIICLYGGSSCFGPLQLVKTESGSVPISQIKSGDWVWSFNESIKEPALNQVKDTFKYKNTKRTIRVKLSNGQEIIATEDHKFYHKGVWVSLKHIVSLWERKHHGNLENNTRL